MSDTFVFQALDWSVIKGDDLDDMGFQIRVFGKTPQGKSVCCTINDYKPYFYLKVPLFDDNGEKIPDYAMTIENFKSNA